MSANIPSLLVFVCVFGAALLGMLLRYVLPEHHLSADTKDTVKLAMGLVATMAALILGLLVASAKNTYDTESSGVTQMAAKIVFLDRMLANYGPETKETRELFRHLVERMAQRMWPEKSAEQSQLDPNASRGEAMYAAIEKLTPKNELQTSLKDHALNHSLGARPNALARVRRSRLVHLCSHALHSDALASDPVRQLRPVLAVQRDGGHRADAGGAFGSRGHLS